jgi:hypothetical protein
MDRCDQIKLLEIIAATGECDHVRHFECKSCPLGRWKKREDGSNISCLEVTDAIRHPGGYKEAYRKAAIELLGDLAVQDLLGVETEGD